MKKLLIAGALAGAAMSMSGCQSMMDVNHQTTTGSLAAESLTVVTRPQEFGVDVLGDTSGEASYEKVFFFTISGDKAKTSLPIIGGSDSPLEALAAYRAAKAKGGDAFYKVTTHEDSFNVLGIYSRKKVTVTGKALKVKDMGTLSADRADSREAAAAVGGGKGFFSSLFGG